MCVLMDWLSLFLQDRNAGASGCWSGGRGLLSPFVLMLLRREPERPGKLAKAMTALLLGLFAWQIPKAAHAVNICSRTDQVEQAILDQVAATTCNNVPDAQLAAVTTLDLSSEGITTLQDSDFSGLSGLTWLALNNNNLTSLPAGVFSGLSSLRTLLLYRSNLTSLPAEVFSGLSSLHTLNLNFNNLTSLPAGIFSGLSILTNITLIGNPLIGVPRILLTDARNLTTSEDGRVATFQMGLSTQPAADVIVTLDSSDTGEGVVSGPFTFTPINWYTNQSVTVTGIDDVENDGEQEYEITFSVTSSDPDYSSLGARFISVVNRDDDEHDEAVIVEADPDPYDLKTSEDGGAVTARVRLSTQPAAAVTVTPSSSDTSEGTVSGPLTFTSSNWDTAQDVTVTGVDDAEDDGHQDYEVTFNITSSDPNYSSLLPSSRVGILFLLNRDNNDHPRVVVTGAQNLVTTEDSGTATFQARLATQPAAAVTVALFSDDTSEGVVSPDSLIFTPNNWNTLQSVTVTGVDDAEDDGDRGYAITFLVTSSDSNYNYASIYNDVNDDVAAAFFSVTNRDNGDEEGVLYCSECGDMETSEAGGTATFQMGLVIEPAHAVTVTPRSSDTSEGTVSGPLTFTPDNWDTAQNITVTGVDDAEGDGDQSYRITFSARSLDFTYNGLQVPPFSVSVINRDDDDNDPGLVLTRVQNRRTLETSEAGGAATVQVRLAAAPTAPVTVTPSSSDTSEGVVSDTLTFTPSNWDADQSVTVTGVDDAEYDGDQTYQIIFSVTSSDSEYNDIPVTALSVINGDNDGASVRVTGAENLETSEAGGTATFQVRLATRPTHEVIVTLLSDDTSEGVVSPDSLTFTPNNWDTDQNITVTGVDDAEEDGYQTYLIIFSVTSSDADYAILTDFMAPLSVINRDDNEEVPGGRTLPLQENPGGRFQTSLGNGAEVMVTGAESLVTSEAGGTDTFQVRLATPPTAAVIVTPSSSKTDEGTVSGPLTFTPSNWDTDQSVTVIGVDDAEVDGDQTYQITFSVTSSDPDYNGIDVAPLVVTSRDDNDPSHRAMAVKAAKQALDTWLPGLGHTVAEQALDAVQGRFQPRPQSSLEWNLAGQSMVGTPLDQHLLAWAKGRGAVTEQQLVEGTSFDLALAPENGAAPGFSFWARGDLARFDREEDDLSLDGNVTTALVGGDWGTEQWSAGAALARSWSSGSYNSGEEEGELSDGSLTALLPYGHYELNPQLSLWGMAGYGWGNLSLTPEGQQAMETMETDINLSLAAVGLEGLLLDGGREGLSIRSTADALLVKVSSEESGALAETESDVSRLRLGLEAVRSFLLEDDASLAPMVEVALRQDGGDAETGFGLDLGAGLDWSAPRQGIRAELEGRVLLYHAVEGFQASGIAASLEWDPTPSTERGPSLSLKHGVGAATGGGMAALLSPAKLPELASSASSQGHQFQALLGYGFAPWGEEGLSIRPEIGLGLSSRGREYNLSWSTFPSVQSGEDSGWEVSTTVKRQENNDSHPSATHSLALHFSLLL